MLVESEYSDEDTNPIEVVSNLLTEKETALKAANSTEVVNSSEYIEKRKSVLEMTAAT